MAEASIAAVGFLGQSALFSDRLDMYPYIESPMLFDCLSELVTQRPGPIVGLAPQEDNWRMGGMLLQRGLAPSVGRTTCAVKGWRLATDWFDDRSEVYCYRLYGTCQFDSRYNWAHRAHIPIAGPFRFRSFYPCASSGLFPAGLYSPGQCRVLSGLIDGTTRSSFPYRCSDLFGSTFATRSNLYANPYAQPSRPFSGLGYTSWLNSTCFD